jgi:hypothetical protein
MRVMIEDEDEDDDNSSQSIAAHPALQDFVLSRPELS